MEHPLPPSRLNLWALTVVAQTVKNADHLPVKPTPRLRLALAWLTVSAGEGQAVSLFWDDALEPMPKTGRQFDPTDHMKAYRRSTSLRLRLEGLCERLGSDYHTIRDYADKVNSEWP